TMKSMTDDKDLMGRAGAADKSLRKAPLRITEKPHQHRAAEDIECYDCGRYIARGEPFVVSALECTKGTKGVAHRYDVHIACYDIVGRVVIILGKDATHSFEGRPSLRDLWAKNKKAIREGDQELAEMLEEAFG